MKKFVSMAMVAAMTVSMVPATAFAGDDFAGTAKVVNKLTHKDTDSKTINGNDVPELQIKLTDVATQSTNSTTNIEFTVVLDNADFFNATKKKVVDEKALDKKMATKTADELELRDYFDVKVDNGTWTKGSETVTVQLDDTNEATVKVTIPDGKAFGAGDVITMDLISVLDKAKNAYVAVESDDITISNDSEDMVYVAIEDEGITASVKKLAKVAEEEYTTLEKDLKIKSTVGKFTKNQKIELKLSNGFEFTKRIGSGDGTTYSLTRDDDDKLTLEVLAKDLDEIVVDADDIEIEATSAKEGAIAKLTVKALQTAAKDAFKATTTVEVMEVTDYKVVMSVDEDEDVPVIYSGVDVANTGITDDSNHVALEVTIKETFPGAWSMHKGFKLELPEGVYVTDLESYDDVNTTLGGDAALLKAFEEAYRETDHKGFEFGKRVFDETEPKDAKGNHGKEHEMTFELTLVADPGFVGDVNLKLTGDALDEQEVTIATFATPYYVTAEQNDMKIDYRYTAVPSNVVIKEAEAGLWAETAEFDLAMEHASGNFFEFEDAEVTVDEASGMEIKEKVSTGAINVKVEEESDEAATITISNIEMFMSRSIPAGPYDLEATKTTMAENYVKQKLFAPDEDSKGRPTSDKHNDDSTEAWKHDCDECDEEYYVGCVADFSTTVKEAFINIVTAGREQDDASFTTKVVVPVGESYIVAGEHQVTLDVPAYVSEAGYTMLPVRAVATALGISNNNVIWNGESKTVTILYGQRIITMTAGEKTVHVNGSVIPASAAVEIVDGRTFLPMRDLATALGVTDITWDAATKTATLNGNA